ncbi:MULTISPECIES: CoA ester lyase [unclassified Brevundimonas]|uniref:HpcH/HpaI aldolase/citrate lyase family protein n=1 Tax=unclassified Brevundimonas TaxID=2622653 RepID=UPI000CFB7529|nr:MULTISPECIES: CoA ester lyase [unclassified Brevundimonas]PRA35787.1 CoA ester lyase [Brevundimonas sp. MYb27]PQZ83116.1 CoA ester lyase [Brevundimonas sp. MYb31]PRB16323.1 CoA ester lyase [Brevundimonas sp. MYb52]PRB34922.1 CoA ester lyase [Brevundimonas sp. MYb46]PRB55570.1 CoA ester lyase [Brevundimonas sp. MYb33]
MSHPSKTRARSVLYLPASNARAVEKARGLTCDVAVLDLEDAVASEMKLEARAAAVAAAHAGGFGPRLGVRINGLDTPWGADDLKALRDTPVDLIVAPKVESATMVHALSATLRPGVDLWAMIETPRALVDLKDIADADGALSGLMLGVNDLAKDLRTGVSANREPLKPWLAAVVAHARANGLLAIDGVFNRIKDEAGFAAECAQGRLYGFDGKSLIHPSQIEEANAAFGPSTEEIEWARKVVAAFAAPEAEGLGVIRVEGEMVERLHLHAAQDLLAGL